ncbi:MAG: insulinase family protein [Bacteroidetes bacterium]|nr:insulinase family protein [Bacteroidota bacterium]
MMNRLQEPELKLPDEIAVPEPEIIELKNGLKVYCVRAGEQEILKLELIFKAGEWYGEKTALATMVNKLMEVGTSTKTAYELSQAFDYYGAYIETECTTDIASVRLFTLTRFAKETFTLLLEMLTDAIYPQEEMELFASQHIQQLRINRKKVEYLARVKFNQLLFPCGHPYGRIPEEESYSQFTSSDLKKWHSEKYNPQNGFIILSGKTDENTIKYLEQTFGEWTHDSAEFSSEPHFQSDFVPEKIFIPVENAVQSAIRIGCRIPNKLHADFSSLTVFNTILGGYFGSRLMSNLREDKGYTYGIGSATVSLLQSGYFFITTQVASNVKEDALKQIYIEINRLRESPVNEDELQLVKNYMIGTLQRSMDGPLAIADRLKSTLIYGLKMNFYTEYLNTIKNITTEQLTEVAQRYFDTKKLAEVVAG